MKLLRWMTALAFLAFGARPLAAQNYTVTGINQTMDLGILQAGSSGGSITLNPQTGGLSYTGTVSGSATGTPATFLLTNTNNSSNSVALGCTAPTGGPIAPATTGLSASAWSYYPATPPAISLPNKGDTATFAVGATLAIPANLASGSYSGTFTGSTAKGNCSGQTVLFSVTVTFKVRAPISITKNRDLDFGTVIANSGAGGTLAVSPGGTRTPGGSVSALASSTFSAAQFTVSGTATATYSITLPASVTITRGASSMTVTTFSSSPASTGTLGTGGSQILTVGAVLNVGANQADGDYAGTFSVTVAYN